MSKIYGSRKAVVLVLVILLLAPWPLAAQEQIQSRTSALDLLKQVWSFLVQGRQGIESEEAAPSSNNPGTGNSSEVGMQVDPLG
jgi:hypothetical protein